MTITDSLKTRAGSAKKHILLADATDDRMLRAAKIADDAGIAEVTLVGDSTAIGEAADRFGIELDNLSIINPNNFAQTEEFIIEYYEERKGKITDLDAARNEVLSDELLFGALCVKSGFADGMLAGSLSTTAAVIRAGIRGIGLATEMRVLSSMFLMSFPKLAGLRHDDIVLAFADGAVIPNPDAYQLADIAISTAKTYQQLSGNAPRIAMLSYSTKGSASSEDVKKVITATEIAKERHPELIIDGELQFDAAFVPEVSERKIPGSPLHGNANVFIFPNLDAGNLGYKIAERLGGGQAIGPILQGLHKPLNDLSRGARVDDIVTMIAVTALQG
ncbi:MAG TPA: phosphate acetyltransferase [Candidatus Kapabacteria bacterium]